MNINTTNSFKRSKARKNKENLVLNKIQKDKTKKLSNRISSDITRFMLNRKPRQKVKEFQNGVANPLLKRFSMQIENEPKTRLDMNGKSGVLSALRKKMSLNYNTRDECKKSKNRHIHNPTTKRRNLKSIEHSSITDNNLLKRKMKTLSSNTIGLSKILRNMERKQE